MRRGQVEMHRDHPAVPGLTCLSCNQSLPAPSAYCPYCGHHDPCATAEAGPEDAETQVVAENKEIRLDQLEAFDYILIQTRNNLYKFTVVEPERGSGWLSGGALANSQLQSILLGAVCCKNSKSVSHALTLKVGLSALFYLDHSPDEKENHKTKRQIATSPIIQLTYVGGGTITKPRAAFTGNEPY